MVENVLNQQLLVSTFAKLRETNDYDFSNYIIKKEYLKKMIDNKDLPYYTYSDALVAIVNTPDNDRRNNLIERVLETTEYDIIVENRKNHTPFSEYIMNFLNYLYYEIYFGTEKASNPKKIKTFLRNEKDEEIKKFRNHVIATVGVESGIGYKVKRIVEIIENFDYHSVDEFIKQLDKIAEYIDRILNNLINLDAIPFLFIFKHIYLPYRALIYRVNGDKTSNDAEYFNFLSSKANFALSAYPSLYKYLEEVEVTETDFSYLEKVNPDWKASFKVSNLAELASLMLHIVLDARNTKLEINHKQILYLFYKDVEILTWEYENLVEFLK